MSFINNTNISINFEFWEKEIKYPKKIPTCQLKLIKINSQQKYNFISCYNNYYIFNTNNEKICIIDNNKIILYDNKFICTINNNKIILEENKIEENNIEENNIEENKIE
jgi:hypothetical protein